MTGVPGVSELKSRWRRYATRLKTARFYRWLSYKFAAIASGCINMFIIILTCSYDFRFLYATAKVQEGFRELVKLIPHENLTLEDHFNLDFVTKTTVSVLRQLLAEFIFHIVAVIGILVMFYAVLRKNLALLTYCRYFGLAYWIFNGFNLIFQANVINSPSRALNIFISVSYGFQHLVIRGYYRSLKEKPSLLTPEITNNNFETGAGLRPIPPIAPVVQSHRNHCLTCRCTNLAQSPETSTSNYVLPSLVSNNNIQSTNDLESVHATELEPKELNFKDESVIYDRDQLQPNEHDLIDNAINIKAKNESHGLRDLKSENNTEDDIIPVIYDEDQLNISGSTLTESIHL